MKTLRILGLALGAFALFLSGAAAGTFNVGAPTGNPATDQTNMQNALNAALASGDPANLVVFDAGGIYQMNDRLIISGQSVKGVTFASSGATPATVVASNWTTGGNELGAFHFDANTGCKFGFSRITLLPAPRSVTGATQAGVTNGIYVAVTNSTCDFMFEDFLLTANNGANAPVSTTGEANYQTFPDLTTFGNQGLRTANPGTGVYTYCNFYFNRSVLSHQTNHCMLIQGSGTGVATEPHGRWGTFWARDSVWSYSLNAGAFQIAGFTSVDLRDCRVFATAVQTLSSQGDGFWVGQSFDVNLTDCTAERIGYHGFSLRTCKKVVLTRCTAQNDIGYSAVLPNLCSDVELVDCRLFLDRLTTKSNAAAFTRGIWADARTVNALLPRKLVVRDCEIAGGGYGAMTYGQYEMLFENCVMHDFSRSAFNEQHRYTGVQAASASLTIRDCTIYSVVTGLGPAINPNPDVDADKDDTSAVFSQQAYVTVERTVVLGSSIASATSAWGLFLDAPIAATVRDCYVAGFNRSGVLMRNGVPTTSGFESDLLVENTTVADCGTNRAPGLPPPPTALSDANNWYAPICLDQGHRLRVRDCMVDTTLTDAVHVNLTGVNYLNSTAEIENVQFTGCRDNLIFVNASDFNGNQITINGVTEVAPNAAEQFPGAEALVIQAATATVSNVTLTQRGGVAIRNAYRTDTSEGLHVYSNVFLDTIGGDGIVSDAVFGGQMRISDTTIRNVTAGSGIALWSGRDTVLSSVEVSFAARYGITLGEEAVIPAFDVSAAELDDLCLFANGLGGLRILRGDRTAGSISLTNSTLLGSPTQLIYSPLAPAYGQILWVTDCIIAGANPGGVGISVPEIVAGPGAPPSPRVRVNTSALVQGGPWQLTTPLDVLAGNPADTVVLVPGSIVINDPGFASTTPGDPDFLAVRSAQYGGKATGTGPGQTTDLDGCSYYIGDLAIGGWRLY